MERRTMTGTKGGWLRATRRWHNRSSDAGGESVRVSETKHLLRRLSTRATISGTRDSSSSDKRIGINASSLGQLPFCHGFPLFQVRRGCRCFLPARRTFGENGDFIKLPVSRSASSVSFFKPMHHLFFSLEESECSEEDKWILFQSTGGRRL